ncbi:hypothetical protein [Lutibacter sp.]|uniref:hypothetical protein n=1 Tax=Lutibacter sp. TaxID=1925666 RepID=UPI0027367FD9|nr:hypothetical protein [Lutibacter sp.]MDP3313131.1 hypothetical protein [Lutibacter sp.]
MTKPEKKAFKIATATTITNYSKLYTLIVNDKDVTSASLRINYLRLIKGASFDTSVNYLYELLLNIMLELRKEQDIYYELFDKISKARILYEKSLYKECFNLLDKIKASATVYENYYALLISSRLELEYLLALNYPETNEKALHHKQFKVNETLRITQKMHQQSALYELLKHRMIYKGNSRSEKQKTELNDLVVSEMSIMASSNLEGFEINKLHQLFQANYLISVGDYKSAYHSFFELNNLLEANKHLWSNPPFYYVLTLEGVLDSLRSLHNYDGMTYYIQQLKNLKSSSLNFNTNVVCLIFLYELFPILDSGDFLACEIHMKKYDETLLKKVNSLSLSRNAELSLNIALIHFGLKKFRKAQNILSKVIFASRDYSYLPLYRTLRLVNLMVLYELKDFDFIKYESRSIKREILMAGKNYKIERRIINFVNKQTLPAYALKRINLWEKMNKDFKTISQDVYEQQTIKHFDFLAWIESKIRRIHLSKILIEKMHSRF